jgi:hypothetical protein
VLFSKLVFLTTEQLLVFLNVSLDLSEFIKKFVMHEDFEVLDVIISLVGSLKLLLRLTRINSL